MEDNGYFTGHLLPLRNILTTNQPGDRYILYIPQENEEYDYVINFGRGRRIHVPRKCYTFIDDNGVCTSGRIIFDENRECNYLKQLEKRGIKYSIPERLPDPHSWYSARLASALGFETDLITVCIGKNGYAISHQMRVFDGESHELTSHFKIYLNSSEKSMRMGDHSVASIKGNGQPDLALIQIILTREFYFDDRELLETLIRDYDTFLSDEETQTLEIQVHETEE